MKIISVVRDFDIYNRLIKNNKFYKNADFIAFDNNKENKYISVRYNEFLNNYDYSNSDWFIFCHEDWELKEDIESKLKNVDKKNLYGPIGVDLKKSGLCVLPYFCGEIYHSARDGKNDFEKFGNACDDFKTINTFDCQCLIVHSDLVKKYKLRFDENLSFDLYVEDFCINAKENFKIESQILNLNCQHYSRGNKQKRFFIKLKYLQKKYKNAKNLYCSICSDKLIGRPFSRFKNMILNFVYSNKITKSNRRLIKICKIPVFSWKLKSVKE